MLNAQTYEIGLAVFAAILVLHGLWRSRGEGAQDPIRDSGPIL